MLDRLYARLPKVISEGRRFEVPKPSTIIVGNRTIVQNFKQICDAMNRDVSLVLRYMAKSLATAAGSEGDQAVFHGRFDSAVIRRLLDDFVQDYVICPVCRRPDTKLVREGRLRFLICEACGAKSSVRPL